MIQCSFSLGDKSLPLMAFAIHNGHFMPPELLSICGVDEASRFREEDPHTDGFASAFPNHAVVHTSRFAFDINRKPEKAVYLQPEDAWGLPVRTAPIPADLLAKLLGSYEAWYRYVDYHISRLLLHHKHLLILDLHSYNHRRGGASVPPDPQLQNPDIIIGRNNLPAKYYPYIEQLRLLLDGRLINARPLDCRCDVKFPGGYFSRWLNSTYPDKVTCLAIEFKKIFMDEWTGRREINTYNELIKFFHQAALDFLQVKLDII